MPAQHEIPPVMEDYEIHQIDILKGTYLNGILTSDEVIFMKQLPGYAVAAAKRDITRTTSNDVLQLPIILSEYLLVSSESPSSDV